MEREKLDRLAVLIDADNAQSSLAEPLFSEIARYGDASVRRAYGDWTTQNLVGWKSELHRLAIQPRPALKPLLLAAIDAVAGDDGWANLGALGSILVKNDPSFDERGYGHKKLSDLARKQKYLKVREEKAANSASVALWVRARP